MNKSPSYLQNSKIAVIGAIHLDRISHASQAIHHDTSTPGKIITRPGGVATNICRALARLNMPPTLIGALGCDSDGDFLKHHLEQLGINTDGIHRVQNGRTGSYLALHEPDGTLFAAVCDSEITTCIPIPKQKCDLSPQLMAATIWLCETNLQSDLLFSLAHNKGNKLLCADTVSVAKAPKLKVILPHIDIIFTNRLEAASLLACSTNTPPAQMAIKMHREGCNLVIITDSNRPVHICHQGKVIQKDVLASEIVDVTGAGDAFIAGFLYNYTKTNNPLEALDYGLAASAITVGSTGAAPSKLTVKALEQRIT
ncbi:carbohydrate kinase family protein [Polycladidibacter stylochi]|uniref:carbohydrate kinase family protein n=1 Tax=Polycladidibacter stylochi TaxID=1807766 RepID=UPI0008307BC1|nr:PfkB family carbohydrate kinase [Pseudovibrio stylochi]